MARLLRVLIAATMASGFAAPVIAQEQQAQTVQGTWPSSYPGAYQGSWQGQYPVGQYPAGQYPVVLYPAGPMPAYVPPPAANGAPMPAPAEADPRYREMVEKCQGVTRRGSGTTGAVIGGVVGGVIGNRVASGNRVLGTVAGAAVGAAAGGAIGNSVDKNRERECQEFFSSYAPPAPVYYGYTPAPNGYSPGYPAYGYAPMGYVMVPANAPQAAQQGQGACTETRTVSYEYVPVKRRYIGAPPRRPAVRDKRIRIPNGS